VVQGLDIEAFAFELADAESNMCRDDGPPTRVAEHMRREGGDASTYRTNSVV
jgi:hypothetical protein